MPPRTTSSLLLRRSKRLLRHARQAVRRQTVRLQKIRQTVPPQKIEFVASSGDVSVNVVKERAPDGIVSRLVSWYTTELLERPIKTNAVTQAVLCGLGDGIAQACEYKLDVMSPGKERYNYLRTARMAAYGFLVAGPIYSVWYRILDRAGYAPARARLRRPPPAAHACYVHLAPCTRTLRLLRRPPSCVRGGWGRCAAPTRAVRSALHASAQPLRACELRASLQWPHRLAAAASHRPRSARGTSRVASPAAHVRACARVRAATGGRQGGGGWHPGQLAHPPRLLHLDWSPRGPKCRRHPRQHAREVPQRLGPRRAGVDADPVHQFLPGAPPPPGQPASPTVHRAQRRRRPTRTHRGARHATAVHTASRARPTRARGSVGLTAVRERPIPAVCPQAAFVAVANVGWSTTLSLLSHYKEFGSAEHRAELQRLNSDGHHAGEVERLERRVSALQEENGELRAALLALQAFAQGERSALPGGGGSGRDSPHDVARSA